MVRKLLTDLTGTVSQHYREKVNVFINFVNSVLL